MHIHAFRIYWLIWFIVLLASFLGPEIYGLIRNYKYTLSWAIWSLEKYVPGQAITKWTAFHFLFIGVLGVFMIWLFFHFAMGLWR